jgi:hypothetical protein
VVQPQAQPQSTAAGVTAQLLPLFDGGIFDADYNSRWAKHAHCSCLHALLAHTAVVQGMTIPTGCIHMGYPWLATHRTAWFLLYY